MSRRRPRLVLVVFTVAFPVEAHRLVRDDVVVLLEGAPNGGGEPAGSGEDMRKVHVLQVRLWIAPCVVC